MKYTSIEQIKSDFDLNLDSIDQIRNELKSKIKKCHPDKVDSTEWDNGLKNEFLNLTEAIEFIDTSKKENSSLVPVDQVTELVKVIKDILPKNEIITQETKFENQLDSFLQERKDVMRFPKISLSVITGLISFVWLFPQTVADHPVLKNYISFENGFFLIGWVIALFYAIMFWVLISRKERREKSLIKYIKTERAQNKIFQRFLDYNSNNKFNKEELIEFILDEYGNRRRKASPFLLLALGSSGIDEETAESLANLLIQKAIQNSLIEKDEIRTSYLDSYKIKSFV
ncbi:hypothetical protein IWQ47_001966 [Aquimarina sp. EL_43]|uniref:hypothetical protein n=1 Tax=unclassified Aquimarina TaxID=2627091 RepID=UPI0018CA7BB1|nr:MULTISPECIES: hypothetical protein [unclassified Aquimarina]MBG6129951.1 hypothetical protein [Aquimarina sp. EL_35]MBG6148731.1 hypothetical protein [Aquimarina sp. EL_32]MBG6168895.1 hypothetical protein [Aquimarina sp. EL_43]